MSNASLPLSTIAAVERETGLGKDTLRVWERRYGFPRPTRDAQGERLYPPEQVEQLRQIRRLLDAGHRPGQIVGMSAQALRSLDRTAEPAVSPKGRHEDLPGLLALLRHQAPGALRAACAQALLQHGLAGFVLEWAVPLCVAVGDAWARGELAVFEEHLCSDVLETVLRGAIASGPEPPAQARPRVLLTTLPGEQHALASLMAQALLSLQGCACTGLGTQLPPSDIERAARAHGCDVVVLSCSAAQPAQQVLQGLAAVRAALPADCALWVGCPTSAVRRRAPAGVEVFDRLDDAEKAVERWRTQRP